ncbi:MAG TPA: winged helix-turn-helix domain-containing protein [Nitrososphaeraceae archaeon]|nr:winged helix-turn-helix domain-containing protein [Nitrososphaeraceae archaeon]
MKDSNQGWSTKQVKELILKENGIGYHHNHIYRIVRKGGFKHKVPRKVHVNTASQEEEIFKKRPVRYLWMLQTQKEMFYPISLDKSFLFYDSPVRRV